MGEETPEDGEIRDGKYWDEETGRWHKQGYEIDSNGRAFDPQTVDEEPRPDRCGALLTNWRERYDEPRYCGQIIPDVEGQEFCSTHKQRKALRMRAKELLEHGLYTDTILHFYDKIEPYEQVLAHGLYDQLLDESVYEFDPDYVEESFDFSDVEETLTPRMVDEDGLVTVEVANPTERHDRALALWNAVIDTIKMMRVNAIIKEKDMQSQTTAHAQLTAPSEDGPPQHFQTIEEWTEHHLNLPYSRLVRDRADLLEYGGVIADVEDDEDEPEMVVEHYYADPLDQEPIGQEQFEDDPQIPIAEE